MGEKKLAVCLSLCIVTAFGQDQRGAIRGMVTDPDGKAVADAQVLAKNESGAKFQAKSSASGSYAVGELPAGKYEVTIASPGLMPVQKKDVAVQAGQTARVDAQLRDFLSLGTVGEDRTFYADVLEAHPAPEGPLPRTPDGKPDFSGVWHAFRTIDPGKPEPLPWADALAKQRQANNFKDFPSSVCLPTGIGLEGEFLPTRIMQNSTVMALLFEDDLPRQIYLDGRKHPDESLSPFVGHSVGKWEGDTLVVDVVGFNDKSWLDQFGHPQTEKMHVTERWTRKDLGHLRVEMTIDDPGAYKKPWTVTRVAELGPDEEVGQYTCTENNRDVPHLVGK